MPSSFGLCPKSIISRVMADGAISAPPTPWTARPAISTAALCAAAASTEPTIIVAQPVAKIFRAPNRSESLPPSRSNPPKTMT